MSTRTTATFHDIDGASVFITGGGAGIGAALTDGFMAQGANVSFVQRSDPADFADEMEAKHGRRPWFQRCDITDTDALGAAIAAAAEANGTIRHLVNNAANDARHTTMEVDRAYWDKAIAINLSAYFFAMQAVIPGMQKAGGGSIVNFSSVSYMMGNAGYPAYVAANAGITGMTRGMAREFGSDRIRINALAPGWVLTDKQLDKWATPDGLAAHLDRQCLKDHLDPKDIVDGVLFLSSGTSRMMTGQALVIDGGVVTTG